MDKLQVRSSEISNVKAKAQEDAKKMQAHVLEECKKAGKDPPSYALVELIGKGSFGRVYMGKDMKSAAIVAVKIIDIDESDTLNPRTADSYSEFLKEVNALKILSENKAKNINHVIEALPVNQAMWMITEYCGGGSVATLMKPSAPMGLMEKWIIPILREVAEALKWVHQAGIIHRDIKCANVLITEQGGVQLCDFGVAGIMENKGNKRSTMVGTPHWMAPEMFGENPSYSQEVDIWAFGAMTYEIATGLPPNVANGIPYERLGYHLKNNMPRLEGGSYSNELRSLVAYLLEEDPKARPSIEQVQKHKYIANTASTYPTTNLRSLVGSFRMWESRGGSRKSLFMQHGAQAPSYAPSGQDEWNFSTTEVFDQKVVEEFSTQDLIDAYGPSISFDEATEATARPRQNTKSSRRRPPPEALARMPAPLEKLFDPNTITNYEDNSRMHYGKGMPSAPSTSDLPLRDDSAQTSIKDTMIDLGGHDTETGISSFSDMDTIKAGRRQDDPDDLYNSSLHDFSRPALSDPADINTNRRTQDWKFPSMAPPASADPEVSRFPPNSYELPRPAVTPGSGGRPTLVHHPTEPLGAFGGGLLGPTQSAMGRLSMAESLIDLDMSLPSSIPEIRRPSTANSDVSVSSEQMTSGNPFELERHASLYQPIAEKGSETAIHISEESSVPTRLRSGNPLQDIADMSDFSASDVEGPQANGRARRMPQYDGADDSDYQAMPPSPLPNQAHSQTSGPPYTMAHFPPLRAPPSVAIMTGTASIAELSEELVQGIGGLHDQLSAFRDVYSSLESTPRRVSATARRENTQD
ncbi:kinase-like protein [Stipitochalara longipes BDJ]|nr:kinase-like protein [Stipitochalara longipes BDJ]